jgi:hypothetical protein
VDVAKPRHGTDLPGLPKYVVSVEGVGKHLPQLPHRAGDPARSETRPLRLSQGRMHCRSS